ncbi:MAG: decaprenyl-phosphate phosphoribosyltransferase [Cyclobacteriaceae bacterium]
MSNGVYTQSSLRFSRSVVKLLRIKQWVKNLFLFIPSFFAGQIFDADKLLLLTLGFLAFSLVASGIYVLNDIRDIEEDRRHPKKWNRILASGRIGENHAVLIMLLCFTIGITAAVLIDLKFAFIVGLYFLVNLSYCFGLKQIAILDVMLISLGFVLRIEAGGAIAEVAVSRWLIIMVYLLALFLAFAKRRDDVLISNDTGREVRKASRNYNLQFLNAVIVLICTTTIVAYLMYALSSEVMSRLESDEVYYTAVFVVAGIIRYLQLIFVHNNTGMPTRLLYEDRFIQSSLLLWVLSFFLLIYLPDFAIF